MKIIIAADYFWKTLHLKYLEKYASDFEYASALNIPEF